MLSIKSRALMTACLMGMAVNLSACATAGQVRIPDSLRTPCESTVDVSGAQTVGDLGKAIIAGDADLRVCDVRREAIVSISEAGSRPWWRTLLPD